MKISRRISEGRRPRAFFRPACGGSIGGSAMKHNGKHHHNGGRNHKQRWVRLIHIGVGAYLLVAGLYILFSDRILNAIVRDPDTLSQLQTYKGWAFVCVTAALIYIMLRSIAEVVCRTEAYIAESRINYRTLLETMNDGVWILDPDGRTLYVNDRFAYLLGVPISELDDEAIRQRLEPPMLERSNAMFRRCRDGKSQLYELHFTRSEGEEVCTSIASSPIIDSKGILRGVLRVVSDISDRYRAEAALREACDSQSRLLDELNHRVRNNLGSLLSLIDLSRSASADVESFADNIRGRIWAISAAHALLSSARWSPVATEDIIRTLITDDIADRVTLSGPPAVIPPHKAGPLAMVLYELLSNSRRHGALAAPCGTLDIAWSSSVDAGAPVVILRWTESGGPPINSPPSIGVGLGIVEGLIRSDLEGSIEMGFPRDGVRHRLEFPAESVPSVAPTA